MKYGFESEKFGLADDSLHLLRSRFSYQTFHYDEVKSIVIENGKQVERWMVLLIMGVGMSAFSLYFGYVVFGAFYSREITRIYIEELIVPIIPFVLGFICIYAGLRNGPTMKVEFRDAPSIRFPLGGSKKRGELDALIAFFQSSDSLKNKTSINL